MLSSDVWERLTISLSQYLEATSAGTPTALVADAYQALDNIWSALLLQEGAPTPYNHSKKLDAALAILGAPLEENGIEAQSIRLLLEAWYESRYSGELKMDPGDATKVLRLVEGTSHVAWAYLAERVNVDSVSIEQSLYERVIGDRWTSFHAYVADVVEGWQQQAEQMGEAGLGSKLTNKMINPAAFADAAAFSDDETLKALLAKDDEVGRRVGELFGHFVDLVSHLERRRFEEDKVDPNELMNFMISIRFRFHGQSLKEISEYWNKAIDESLERVAEMRREGPPNV